jgi:PAS domain S-box-containing protein
MSARFSNTAPPASVSGTRPAWPASRVTRVTCVAIVAAIWIAVIMYVALLHLRSLERAADELATLSQTVAELVSNVPPNESTIAQIGTVAGRLATLSNRGLLLFDANGQLISGNGHAGSINNAKQIFAQIAFAGVTFAGRITVGGQARIVSARKITVPGTGAMLVVAIEVESRIVADYLDDLYEVIAFAVIASILALYFSQLLSGQFDRRDAIERALAEREASLTQQHDDLVEAQKMAKLGSWTSDADGRIIFASEGYLRIFGLGADAQPKSAEEWLRRFADPAQRVEAIANVEKIRQRQVVEGTRLIALPDGSTKWVTYRALPIAGADGRFAGYRGVVRDISVEKHAELLLASKTLELESAKKIAGLGTGSWEIESDRLTVCENTLDIYEVTPDDCPGTFRDWGRRFFRSDEIEKYRREYEVRFGGRPINNIRSVITGKGNPKWIHTLGTPIMEGEVLVGYRGISRDITSDKIAEQRLADSEQRYRLISESMQDIVALHAADGTVLYASPSLTRTLGYPVEKTVGTKAFNMINPADFAHVKAALDTVVNGKAAVATAWYRFPHADGHECWLETVITPVRQADGQIRQYQATTREITQRKRVELALRASEERFRSLTELSSDWYWEIDAQFRFTFMSRDRTRWTRKSREDLMGKTRWEIFPRALSSEEWAMHRADLEAHRPFYNLVMRVVDPETHEVRGYSALSGQPVFDDAGLFAGYRGTGQDITERKFAEEALARRTRELAQTNNRLEEEARRRQQLERDFLMAIELELAQVGLELHDDLGQDLTGVALLTKTLEKKLSDRGFAEHADAARISDLVNRTIRHTRMISHGLSPYIWGSAGLVSALTQLASDIDSLGVVHCEAEIDKAVEIRDEVVARNIYRIAQESINNALKHSRAQNIGLSLTRTPRQIQLTIADDGIGRAESDLRDDGESKFHSIRHRANSMNAKLSIRRGRSGGTVVRVTCAILTEPAQQTNIEEETS